MGTGRRSSAITYDRGNHVKFASFVLLAVGDKRKQYFNFFSFNFWKIQNNQGLGKGYKLPPSASADNPYLDLDYSGYHKNLIQ